MAATQLCQLQSEARLLKRLSHPNIMPVMAEVTDPVHNNRVCGYVMPEATGGCLWDVITFAR